MSVYDGACHNQQCVSVALFAQIIDYVCSTDSTLYYMLMFVVYTTCNACYKLHIRDYNGRSSCGISRGETTSVRCGRASPRYDHLCGHCPDLGGGGYDLGRTRRCANRPPTRTPRHTGPDRRGRTRDRRRCASQRSIPVASASPRRCDGSRPLLSPPPSWERAAQSRPAAGVRPPSPLLVCGDTPPGPSARGDDAHGRPAASAPPPPRHLAVARRALREARRRSPRRAAPRRHRAARRSHVEPPRPRPARAPPRLPRRRDGVSPPPLPPPPSAPLPPAGPAARRARLLPQPSPGARRPAAPSVPARPPPSRRPSSAERRPLSADESSSSSSRASAQSRPSRRGRAAISSACRARRRSVFGPPRSPLGGQRTDAPRDPSSRRRGRAALRPIDAARTVRVALRAASHEPRARRAITRRRRLPKCREEVSENRNF